MGYNLLLLLSLVDFLILVIFVFLWDIFLIVVVSVFLWDILGLLFLQLVSVDLNNRVQLLYHLDYLLDESLVHVVSALLQNGLRCIILFHQLLIHLA